MINELAKRQLQPTVNRREAWRSETETQRKAILRDCPRDMAADPRPALARVAGVMQPGQAAPLARRALIKGLLADGHSAIDVARALAAPDDEMVRARGALPIHEPSAKKLGELLSRTLPPPDNYAGYNTTSSPGEDRQGNLRRGSRGWRTPPDGFPQTQPPPHP